MNRIFAGIVALMLAASAALAQSGSSFPLNNIPLGKGNTVSGWKPVAPGSDGQCLIIVGSVPTFAACLANTTRVTTTNTTILTSDCGNTVQVGIGTSGFFTITLPAASGFPADCIVYVGNGDGWSSRGKALSGFPSDFTNGKGVLWPKQTGAVKKMNGAWASYIKPGRAKLPGGTTQFYSNFTNTAGDNSGNDCLSATISSGTGPCQTVQQTMFLGCNEFDFTSIPQAQMQVNVAANVTDTAGVHYACHAEPGAQGGAAIFVSGGVNATINTSLSAACMASSSNCTDAFAIEVGSIVSVNGLTLQATGLVTTGASSRPADCLRADYGGRAFVLTNTFNLCNGSALSADNGGNIYVFSTFNINANSNGAIFHAKNGGVISTGSQISGFVTGLIGANITIGQAWAWSEAGGTIVVPAFTWNYGAGGPYTITGTKAATEGTGSIFTNAGTANCNDTFFPGTVNGAVAAPYCK